MMVKFPGRYCILTLLILLAGFSRMLMAAAEEDFAYCLVCHGAEGNGNPVLRAPKISGLQPWYLQNQLRGFIAGYRGTRPDDIPGREMRSIVRMLEDEQAIIAAAKYIGALPSEAAPVTVAGDAERGRQLYQTCAACHGEQAQGNRDLQAPALAIQSDWYLLKQLGDFRSGARGAHPNDKLGAQMRPMAQMLPDEQAIRDVIAYIKTLAVELQ